MLAQVYVTSNRQAEAIEKLRAFTEKSGGVTALLQLAGLYEKTNNFAAAAKPTKSSSLSLRTTDQRSTISRSSLQSI